MDPGSDWVASGDKGALDFDGSNDYVRVPGSFDFLRNTDKTVMAWIRTSSPGASFRTVFSRDKTFAITVLNSVFITYDWVSSSSISSGVNVANGAWRHICVSIKSGVSSGSLFFVDGLPVGSLFTYSNQIGNTAVDASIMTGLGSTNMASAEYVNGQLDDAILFNTALTASEVREIYRRGRGYGIGASPHRSRRSAAGFKAYWARRQSQLIGGGV
jgi:hypothetical protein